MKTNVKTPKRNRIKSGKSYKIFFAIVGVYLFVWLIAICVPFLWGILTSLKENVDYRYNMFGLPKKWMFSNYLWVLNNFKITVTSSTGRTVFNFWQMMLNSFAYCAVASAVYVIAHYIMAYATTFFDYRFNRIIDFIVVLSVVVPVFGTLPSTIRITKALGLFDNFWGVSVIMRMGFLSMDYFIIKGCLKGVSGAYIEAAKIDGAKRLQILARILVPMTFGIVFTIFVLQFMVCWNNYQISYIYLPSMPTASYGLWQYKQKSQGPDSYVMFKMAACFLVAIPSVIVFAVFHNMFMDNLQFNGVGVKG